MQEILKARRLAITTLDHLLQTVEVVHGRGRDGAVIVPHIVKGPEVLADHLLQRLTHRNLGTNARLRIEAEGTTRGLLEIPVVGRHIVVWPSHLHA